MTIFSTLERLVKDRDGAMAIETGIVAGTLALLSMGSFQVSSLVARQTEMQGAAAEAAAIALAAKPDTTQKLATVKSILMASTGLNSDQISVTFRYKCGTQNDIERTDNCSEGVKEWKFVRVRLRQTYTPPWRGLGIGSDVNLRVVRLVQIK